MRTRPMFFLTVLAAVLAALSLAACASAAPSSSASSASASSAASASSSSASSSGTVALDVSDTVFITLDYSAGTGFEWTYAAEPEGVLVEVDKATESLAEGDVTGGPLRDTYTFTEKQPGQVVLTFNLVRDWEDGAQPAETQVYAFTVLDTHEIVLDREKSDFTNEPEWIAYS